MPHRTRPMAALLMFTGLNMVLVSTITPVYDFVCFHPYWERRYNTIKKLSKIFVVLLSKSPGQSDPVNSGKSRNGEIEKKRSEGTQMY